VGLIAAAGIAVAKVSLLNLDLIDSGIMNIFNWKSIILAAAIFAAMKLLKKYNLHPLVYIAASAVVGIVFKFAG
jgi:chromate transporter